MNLSIAIMAGGASSRMGRDKAMLPVGSETMLERTARVALATGLSVIVVGRSEPEGWKLTDVHFIPDECPGSGPLAGLATALRSTRSGILALACDMPLITADAIRWMLEIASEQAFTHGVIVRNGDEVEPLFSIYTVDSLPLIDVMLADGRRAMKGLIEQGGFARVEALEWVARQLLNVNTPEDMIAAMAASSQITSTPTPSAPAAIASASAPIRSLPSEDRSRS